MAELSTTDVQLRGAEFTCAMVTKLDRAFWTQWAPQGWESDTFDFIEETVAPGTLFLDFGAWLGPFSLFAASKGANVIALEPDPVAYGRAAQNVALNQDQLPGTIDLRQQAFDREKKKVRIFGGKNGFGTSGSSLHLINLASTVVPTITVDEILVLSEGSDAASIKVDIESHEFHCAADLARLRRELACPMHISIHPGLLRRSLSLSRLPGNIDAEVEDRTLELIDQFSDAQIDGTNEALSAAGLVRKLMRTPEGALRDFTLVLRN
ncbi:MAG: FkbM family methyltransferase [Pseudomonadota bacterium]